MQRRSSLRFGSSVLFAILAQAAAADAGCYFCCCRRADPCRGSAIRSPLESPDLCDSPVGGKYVHTPYYPGYAPDRRCPLPTYSTTNYGITGPGFGTGRLGSRPATYGQGNYGAYSGANQDEAHLLHLGGFGPGGKGSSQPHRGDGDVIDRIEGNQ